MPYIDCEKSFVSNTAMKIFSHTDGRQTQYIFCPDKGYVIHIRSNDDFIYDDNCEKIVEHTERYCSGNISVSIKYDFSIKSNGSYSYTDENGVEISIPFEKTGIEELYTLPADIVPPDKIY